jgi:hypothetical protein
VFHGQRVQCQLAGRGPRVRGVARTLGQADGAGSFWGQAAGTTGIGNGSFGSRRLARRSTGAMPACWRTTRRSMCCPDTLECGPNSLGKRTPDSMDDGTDAGSPAEAPEPSDDRMGTSSLVLSWIRWLASICTDESSSNPPDDEPWSASAGVGSDSTETRFPFVGRRTLGCFDSRLFGFREAAPSLACRVRSRAVDDMSDARLPDDDIDSPADGLDSFGRRTPDFHEARGMASVRRQHASSLRTSASIPWIPDGCSCGNDIRCLETTDPRPPRRQKSRVYGRLLRASLLANEPWSTGQELRVHGRQARVHGERAKPAPAALVPTPRMRSSIPRTTNGILLG